MWKDYFKGILNFESSANASAESVKHSMYCKENYLGLEIPMRSVVLLKLLLQKLPLNRHQGLIAFLQSTCFMQMNLCVFFLNELFNVCIVHGYIPNTYSNTTIIPVCKNKNGNMPETPNYRPVQGPSCLGRTGGT